MRPDVNATPLKRSTGVVSHVLHQAGGLFEPILWSVPCALSPCTWLAQEASTTLLSLHRAAYLGSDMHEYMVL